MSWNFSGYSLLQLLTAGTAILVAFIAWRRHTKLNKVIALLMLAVAVWPLANGLEAAVVEMPAKIHFAKLSYVGLSSVPPLFLMLALVYSKRVYYLTRPNLAVLWAIPLLTIGLVAFNEWHNLIWSSISTLPGPDGLILINQRGPYFWVQTIYSFLLVLSATILLIWVVLWFPKPYKSSTLMIIIAALLPWGAVTLYLFQWSPLPGINLSQVSFLLSGILFIWAIDHRQVFDLTPIARGRVLDTLPDAIIVINALGQTLDLNPAACLLIETSIDEAIGQPAADLLRKWPYLAQQLETIEKLEDTTIRNTFQDVGGRWYILTLSRLRDKQQEIIGWVFWLRDISDQRTAEIELSRLAKVIEQVQETVIITDLDGNISYANPYFEQTTGYTVEEALGKNPSILQSGIQNKSFYTSLWNTIGDEQSWSGTLINKRKDGSLYHEAATIFPILSKYGEKTHFAAVKHDITRQVEAEDAQRRFTHKLEKLHEINLDLSRITSFDDMCRQAVLMARDTLNFEHVGIWFVNLEDPNWLKGSFGLDESGDITDMREQFIEIDVPIFEALSLKKQRVFYDPDHDLLDHNSRIVNKGETAAAALWDGMQVIGFIVIDNLISQTPISSFQREILFLFGQIIGNLASKTRAELAIRENERRYRLLADNALDVIWTMSLDGHFTYISPAVEQLRGFTPDEVMQQSMEETLTPDSLKIAYKVFDEMLSSIQSSQKFATKPYYELEQPCKDGTTVWTEVIITLMYDKDDTPLGVLGVTRDITERKKNENNLQEYARQQALLNQITQTAIQQTNFNQMLQTLADSLGDLLGADSCYITLWDEKTQTTIPAVAYGNLRDKYREVVQPQPGKITLTETVLTKRDILVINDVLETNYLSRRIVDSSPPRSCVALPLIANNQKLGAALIAFHRIHEFSQAEIDISKQAAQQIALAILKTRLLEEAEQRAKEAETLRLASAAIAATLEQDQAIERILEELNRVVPYESASVLLSDGIEMEIVGTRGFPNKEEILGLRFSITSENPTKVISETRQSLILADAPTKFTSFHVPPHDQIRGWMGIPLLIHDNLIGMLTLDSYTPDRFTPDHARLATAFASQVAIALENARLFEETRRLAITDSLTNLYNRRHFMELARREFDRSTRYKTPLSVIMLDIDHFKRINDTHGHLVGDQVLQNIAKICRINVRSLDTIGRYGGEEFVIFLPETPLTRPIDKDIKTKDLNPLPAQIVAERLRQTFAEEAFSIGGNTILITVSLGVAEFTKEDKSIEEVIDHADKALLQAKNRGRNRVIIWNPKDNRANNSH